MILSVPYGKGEIDFEVPGGFNVTIVEPNVKSFVKNIQDSTRKALSHPINSKKLSDLAEGKSSACIVVTDITRSCPDKELLPPILDEIEMKIKRNDITILIASGMHRQMSYDEKVEKYGKNIVDNYRIVDHDARDENNHINLGNTRNGIPIKISKIAHDADLVVSLGVVEPHQYAGFSGGYKTVAIGVAGDETISQMHSLKMLETTKNMLGKIDENPFQEDVIEIGKKVGLNFIVNVILGKKDGILEIEAGEPNQTHQTLVKKAKEICEVMVENSFDVAICGVGYPKDTNLYQVSRAASYLLFVSKPVVREGGYIIIPAVCEEGAGKGVGEERFFSMLKSGTIDEILTRTELKAGEQRAFLMGSALKHCKVIIVGSSVPQVVKDAKMIPTKDMDEAFRIVENDLGKDVKVIIVRDALQTLPIIQ